MGDYLGRNHNHCQCRCHFAIDCFSYSTFISWCKSGDPNGNAVARWIVGKGCFVAGRGFCGTRPGAGNDSLTAYVLGKDGNFTFFDLLGNNRDYKVLGHEQATPPAGSKSHTISFVERFADSMYSLLWSDGSISLVEAELNPHFDETGRRSVKHALHIRAELPAKRNDTPLKALARRSEEGSTTFVKLLPDNKISITQKSVDETLLGEKKPKASKC